MHEKLKTSMYKLVITIDDQYPKSCLQAKFFDMIRNEANPFALSNGDEFSFFFCSSELQILAPKGLFMLPYFVRGYHLEMGSSEILPVYLIIGQENVHS